MPSFNDMVVKACALALQRVPARQRLLQGRALRALLAGQRRDRGGGARTRWSCRRSSTPTRRGSARSPRDARALAGKRPRRLDHAAGALRGHVHRLEPRDVRGDQLHRRDQLAAGRDPRGRGDRREAGGARRRDRRAASCWASPSPAITGSSTAPTAAEFLAADPAAARRAALARALRHRPSGPAGLRHAPSTLRLVGSRPGRDG